jgi:hypothetical protein
VGVGGVCHVALLLKVDSEYDAEWGAEDGREGQILNDVREGAFFHVLPLMGPWAPGC